VSGRRTRGTGRGHRGECAQRRRLTRLRSVSLIPRRLDFVTFRVDDDELQVAFTLTLDTAKGNRPSFARAARPERAEPLYERFCLALRELGVHVATGVFGARMVVELENDGPVTIVLDAGGDDRAQ
jgi:hypothetical protein